MSSLNVFSEVRQALHNLNPAEVRQQAERRLGIALVAQTPAEHWQMESYFCPPELSAAKRAEVSRMLHRAGVEDRGGAYDLEIWDRSLAIPEHVFPFDPDRPQLTIDDVLRRRPDLALPLARYIYPFRKPVVDQTIHAVARENAMFSVATALPDIVPLLTLPWALGEFASDTAFLTMNQIRMTFLIGAASDCAVGYREQRNEIGSIVAGAFGFRAIARELVGKIPLGGGLIPKAAIAWTGTYVIGRSMERLYRLGYAYTREERKSAFEQALEKGREIATSILGSLRRAQAT
jgi:hypothetical protein